MVRLFSIKALFLMVALGTILSIHIGYLVHRQEQAAFKLGFEKDVADKAAAIERELLVNIEVLYAVKGLYDSSEKVTHEEFSHLAESFIARHPNIQALEWIPKVLDKDRLGFELEIQQYNKQFTITEKADDGAMVIAGYRQVYFPVTFLTPMQGNEAAYGFDLASSPTRFASLEQSRDSGEMTASGSMRLVQEAENQKGFLIFMPVYKGQSDSLMARREALQGFVLGVFRIGDIVASAIDRISDRGIAFTLLDITQAPETLFEQYGKQQSLSEYQYSVDLLPIGGRSWRLLAYPRQAYYEQHMQQMSAWVSLYGVILILVFALYIYGVIRRKELIKLEVIERTADLNEANQRLETLSQTDSLTHIANRRLFDSEFEQEWSRAQREGAHITLIMIDIDCFKAYNDLYGHQAGDECLRKVAECLKTSLRRPADLLARYGGEEFVILLPNTKNAAIPAKRCCADIQALNIPHQASSVAKVVTASVGGISLIPTSNISAEYALSLADSAMYQAKASGRNRVKLLKAPQASRSEVS